MSHSLRDFVEGHSELIRNASSELGSRPPEPAEVPLPLLALSSQRLSMQLVTQPGEAAGSSGSSVSSSPSGEQNSTSWSQSLIRQEGQDFGQHTAIRGTILCDTIQGSLDAVSTSSSNTHTNSSTARRPTSDSQASGGGGPSSSQLMRAEPSGEDVLRHGWTSLMVTNIPPQVSQDMLQSLLAETGFADSYDFFYAPRIFKSGAGRGYAFINFVNCSEAARFLHCWSGAVFWRNQKQPLSIVKADSQGIEELMALCHKHKLQRIKNPSFRPFVRRPWEVHLTL